MRKGFRPSLEAPPSRRVNLDGSRPLFCVFVTSAVILLIFIVFIVSAWSVYSHQFTKTVHQFHAGDQVALLTVTDDLMATFCNGYQVTFMDHDEAYVIPHRADINQSHTATSHFSIHHEPDHPYSFLEVYLLKSSTLELGACRENGSIPNKIHILLIKGGDNFHTWRLNPYCTKCLLRHVTVLPSVICEEATSLGLEVDLNVTITKTDQYVLVVHYDQADQGHDHRHRNLGVIVRGFFNRTRYDVRDSEVQCRGKQTCDFDLAWGSTRDIVIALANQKHRIDNDLPERTFTSKCQIRLSFWILVFCGSPVLITVPIAAIFAWFLCRRSRKPSLDKLTQDALKRVTTNEVSVRDDAGLASNEVCMAIQD